MFIADLEIIQQPPARVIHYPKKHQKVYYLVLISYYSIIVVPLLLSYTLPYNILQYYVAKYYIKLTKNRQGKLFPTHYATAKSSLILNNHWRLRFAFQ